MRMHQLHPASENRSLYELALRRYPDSGLFAIDMLLSDRRAAGLGALDERRRSKPGRGRGNVECYKYRDGLTDKIHYRRRIDMPPRDWIDPRQFASLDYDDINEHATVRVEQVPARRCFKGLALPTHLDLVGSQRDRKIAAEYLRELRRATFEGEP